ncbi:hypothetical protein QEN19_000271 [Hanseniaspora menglaensis]
MAAYWRSIGYTYNKFVATQAAVLRKSLKTDLITNKVQERARTEVKVIKFANGSAQEPEPKYEYIPKSTA